MQTIEPNCRSSFGLHFRGINNPLHSARMRVFVTMMWAMCLSAYGGERVIATVLGRPIYYQTLDGDVVRSQILNPLFKAFDKTHQIVATDSEIKRLADKIKKSAEKAPALSNEQAQSALDPFIRSYRRNKLLYEMYGGTVIWQQPGLEAVGAEAKWLRSQEDSGDLVFHDQDVRSRFYSYFDSGGTFVVKPKDIDFSKPWWDLPESISTHP